MLKIAKGVKQFYASQNKSKPTLSNAKKDNCTCLGSWLILAPITVVSIALLTC